MQSSSFASPFSTSLNPCGSFTSVLRPAMTDLRISASITRTRLPISAKLFAMLSVTVVFPSFSPQLVSAIAFISCPQNCRLVRNTLYASCVKKSLFPGSFSLIFSICLTTFLRLFGALSAIGGIIAVVLFVGVIRIWNIPQDCQAKILRNVLVGLDGVVR